MANRTWTHDELLLAFNLYCKLPFGQYNRRNAEVIELAHLIGRTPSAVAMKLSNFVSLDPHHQRRGISGLSNIGKADKAAWDEFTSDWENTIWKSEVVLAQLKESASFSHDDSGSAVSGSPELADWTVPELHPFYWAAFTYRKSAVKPPDLSVGI